MERKDLKIIFMGNPDFARHHLEVLVNEGFKIVAVVSAPDKPAGRGMKLRGTAVTEYARTLALPVLQPKNLKDPEFIEELRSYNADIQVVIAFRMLPEVVWNMPPMGTVNIHASLLPQYRGAAPINWAIINGEKETGVTSFKLKHDIDTGDILLQERCEITPTDTAGSLHDKLMHLGASTIVRTLDGLLAGDLKETPQQELTKLRNAPKLFSNNCIIDFDQKGERIVDFVRGLNPYPAAYFILGSKRIKVYACRFEPAASSLSPGQVQSDNSTYISVGCANGEIQLTDIQYEGKKRMPVEDFLRGYTEDLNSL